MFVLVSEGPNGALYDLIVDGRVREYDVDSEDLQGAIRRARVDPTDVLIQDETGHATRLVR